MEIKWTIKSLSDLNRLFEFLAPVNKQAAAKTIQSLTQAPTRIIHQPRIGERLDEFEPKEVRRLLVGHYEMRYELRNNTLFILRIWHTRERR
ncbi:type II toxin-antitoxin system RelE/ParE family toxin [Thalassomonas viridans]|uniref:Type II toxin-antitoxin system RelE/ParE family toxin n=1 Tax=Thalassomonas viridans TaxID=137584 RepID=A0AAF0CAH9_9GAMM|nr:type II toxin-antitoxin system RelE/ParE family toxin [Thalassomonas viridans]WDE06883.1 type II toxin-antitoxin system RelE/ParE family toxin [Thalassomonas viridans]